MQVALKSVNGFGTKTLKDIVTETTRLEVAGIRPRNNREPRGGCSFGGCDKNGHRLCYRILQKISIADRRS